MWRGIWVALAVAGSSSGAWAVMKCTGHGKTWYQDAPCEAGSSGAELRLDAAPAVPAAPAVVPQAPAMAAPAPVAPVAAQAPSSPQAPALEQEAQACLAWYQREEPRMLGSQYLSASKEKDVLTVEASVPYRVVTVPYQGNGVPYQGSGVVTPGVAPAGTGVATVETGLKRMAVSCEVRQGRIDEGWTRIHAKRVAW